MTTRLPLDCEDGIASFRPAGSMPLAAAVTLVETAIREARRRQCLTKAEALAWLREPV